MAEYTNRRSQGNAVRPFKRYFWWMFVVVPLLGMVIPSLVVLTGNSPISMENDFKQNNQQKMEKRNPPSRKVKNAAAKAPITLGWVSGTSAAMQNLKNYQDLHVVSPEFVSIDRQGNIKSKNPSETAQMIHQQGKKIWSRISMEVDTQSNNHAFLSNTTKSRQAIQTLEMTALQNHWEGINLDIENVDPNDRDRFSQFVKALSASLHKSHISLSVDIPPDPKKGRNNLAPFDHALLAKYCDYVIFMGYDQHWSTDPAAGPVTSLSWLEGNIKEFIQTGIPSKKLILGLPSYTRIWESDPRGDIVKDPAYSVEYVENLMEENHLKMKWDSSLGEYYVSYKAKNIQYQVWLTNLRSYDSYLHLLSAFHLAGTAFWNLNLMTSSFWNSITENNPI